MTNPWNGAINDNLIVGFVTALLVAWNTWRAARSAKVVRSIHTLTNSAMASQLKVNVEFSQQNAVLSHRLADISKSEGDIAAAVAADVVVEAQKQIYQEHMLKQAKVDARDE
jgi:hypothetical protein